MDLLTTSATEQLAALERGDVTAEKLLDMALERVAALNPQLNAVVAMDVEAARAAARDSDARRAAGRALPLDGLPVTIKDSYAVRGMATTAGAPALKDHVPEEDATAVARLRAAGAVIYGKTNVPAFTSDWQSFNAIYGSTSNPWDLARSPGGSSGGAAAAVATGMSSLEWGSDIGGSIRWPAHCCGLFGHKSTWDLTPMRGHIPPAPGVTSHNPDLGVGGPIARSAADLALALSLVAGADSPQGALARLEPPRRESPEGLRVAVWLDEPAAPVSAPVAAAVRAAARALEKAGAVVSETARPAFSFFEAFEVYALMNHAIALSAVPEKVRQRLAANAANFAPDDHSHQAQQCRAAGLGAAEWRALVARREKIKQAWAEFFAGHDVVLAPPATVTAILHDHNRDIHARRLDLGDGASAPYFDLLHWASLATVAHLPATVAPVPQAEGALPAGVQVIGPEGADLTTIAVAGMLERLLGGYTPPPLVRQG
ncbi:amidase [Camelimonas abortus]|uniref:Amidase n=1 Tax=Camelimonas abortus TaxID=1017184 RepID=A0ABV7LCQ0_9HYPH